MNAGSGGRLEPYIRIAIEGKTAFDILGNPTNDRALTHIPITEESIVQIMIVIEKIIEEVSK